MAYDADTWECYVFEDDWRRECKDNRKTPEAQEVRDAVVAVMCVPLVFAHVFSAEILAEKRKKRVPPARVLEIWARSIVHTK